jgi:hypothetical protein
MSGLAEIQAALATTIRTYSNVDLFVYDGVEDMGNLPAIIVEPLEIDYEGAFARGMHTYEFNVFVLVGRNVASVGNNILNRMVSGTGNDSIYSIIEDHPDLGLGGSTTAQVYMMKGYGGSFDWAKISHTGAVLKVRVHTDGAS